MKFMDALSLMSEGYLVKRESWEELKAISQPMRYSHAEASQRFPGRNAEGIVVVIVLSEEDKKAEDWVSAGILNLVKSLAGRIKYGDEENR